MSRSANEVMVLATKAARGAGAPPSQAAHYGMAVVAHLCAGRQEEALIRAMADLPAGPIIDLPLAISAIAEMAQDGQAKGHVGLAEIDLACSYIEALPYQGHLAENGEVQLDLTKPAKRLALSRINLPERICDQWAALAARLLVPESDASRLSGAGAGLSDND